MNNEQLLKLQEQLNYTFKNKTFLAQAMTHSSYANDSMGDRSLSNERLEFLGDSLLGMIVALIIYSGNPLQKEGSMSRLRAEFICEKNLAELAITLDLGSYIKLGKGEENTGGRTRPSILADAFEALLAAIYLDGGFEPVYDLISSRFTLHSKKPKEKIADYKTLLQELIQLTPDKVYYYNLSDERGPDHDKTFHVEVIVDDVVLGTGVGKTKKGAQQEAAKEALEKLK
ncbi:MAG: ribonuclease III [Oscillospiraceae bacterium]|nr:ribonuclease III [Oscillospiraceae bacterium]